MRTTLAPALGLLLASCASYQVNPFLESVDSERGYRYEALERPASNTEETFVVLTLSGGGTRAAALAFGALQHLDSIPIPGGRTLLDEVDVISSVSGGSFVAAYYALSEDKEQFFDEFPDAVLYRRIQSALVKRVLRPWNWPRLFSPRFGRSDLLNQYYHRKIFKGVHYGELPSRLPLVVLNATDMSLGAQFPFTQEHFDRLCSDLSRVQLSRAVLSSSAFPGAFSPVTWKNYPDEECGYRPPDWVELGFGLDPECLGDPECRGDLESNPERFDRARVSASYGGLDRRFIHVVDGGVSDNLGLRGPIVAATTGDSPWSVVNRVNLGKIQRLAVIVVDARRRDLPKRDRKASPPGALSVLSAAASRPMANYSTDSVELLRRRFTDWDSDAADYEALRPECSRLADESCQGSPHADCVARATASCRRIFRLTDEDQPPHPDLYRVHVRFDAIRKPGRRERLQRMPTALQLPRESVDELIEAAKTLLGESEDFQRLVRDLSPEAADAAGPGAPQDPEG